MLQLIRWGWILDAASKHNPLLRLAAAATAPRGSRVPASWRYYFWTQSRGRCLRRLRRECTGCARAARVVRDTLPHFRLLPWVVGFAPQTHDEEAPKCGEDGQRLGSHRNDK